MKFMFSSASLLALFTGVMGLTNPAFGQSASYQSAIKKGIQDGKSAKTGPQFVDVANYFERISAAEKAQWLPAYYAAFYNFLAGVSSMQTPKLADPIFDKASSQLDLAAAVRPNESEILALKAQISYLKMAVDPQNRFQMYGPLAKSELDSAAKLDPNNPRVDFIRGSQLFYTPEQYGGGKAVAKPVLEAATAKFKAFKPATEIAPAWGAEQCQQLLDACNK